MMFSSGGSAHSIPKTPSTGELYYDTGRLALMVYNGTSWDELHGRTNRIDDSISFPEIVVCHRYEDREVSSNVWLTNMPTEPCERWLLEQGLVQGKDFNSYYNAHFGNRLCVRFKDPDLAAMFKTVWGGERVKA